jgi:lipopolysaccharide biosynthesis regulator YciM
MSVWWFLLTLTALFIAWYLGYRTRDEDTSGQKVNLPRDYLVGLNYLLNEEPDKAVDVFIKMLEVDSSTVETHLAVGKLFRRRGEVDRAIRIHQNLIARPQLDKNCREQSLFELGQDYLSAGVLDREFFWRSLPSAIIPLPLCERCWTSTNRKNPGKKPFRRPPS